MSLRPILIHPDPRLKKPADPVTGFDAETRRLADDMLETMYDAPGIGLAAPQIGVMQRLLVMDCVKEDDAPPRPMVLINPRIDWSSETRSTYEEGCLSFPEIKGDVARPERIRVEYQDLDGAPHSLECDELLARCIQHEVDHLDGILFIDRMEKSHFAEIRDEVRALRKRTLDCLKEGKLPSADQE